MAKRNSSNDTAIKEKNVIKKSDNGKDKNEDFPEKSGTDLNGFKKDFLLNVLNNMLTARNIDNKAMNLLRQGKTFFHIAGAGHEAVQTAAGMLLNPKKDWIFPYYRDIAVVISAGVTPKDFFLQSFAKEDDPSSGGRQLSCHWGSNKINIPSQSSPTGTQFLNAVGAALAMVKENKEGIVFVSSGEGTTSQGEFHEAVNWASREKLPVLFVIENNKYAISVPVSKQSGGREHSVAEMMSGYENLLNEKIDGTDFFLSYNKIREAIDYIRKGNGPALIEADVVRLLSHSSSDDQKKYRTKDELEEDLKNCPIEKLKKLLIKNEIITKEEFEEIMQRTSDEVNNAADAALKADDPDPDSADKHVFDESGFRTKLEYEKNTAPGNKIVMVDAINHALKEEMKRNDKIYVFGEDVADNKGGVFTATKGLTKQFGEDRVFNSPLAEASIIGVAVGMALTGLKPVVEIQFGDYIWPGFMQIKSELSTIRYRSNNNWAAPVVIRVAVGGYIHGGLYHSQNIESIFAHVPGLFIAYPSNAADAKGLLKTACRINDPVLFCEHKGLYRQSFAISEEPSEDYLVPFGKAKVVKEGDDLTVVSYGVSMWDSINAAKKLEEEGYSVEVIDIRTIIPLDDETIFNSVKKTNKVVIIHEDTLTAGFGAEIASRISEKCFQYLDGPVRRIAAKDSHIPYSPKLENSILPNRKRIYNGIKELLEY
ncbi:MAG: dehydrogenase E1 component subunit alpha/beta [Ignavibacteriaceae bacterium]